MALVSHIPFIDTLIFSDLMSLEELSCQTVMTSYPCLLPVSRFEQVREEQQSGIILSLSKMPLYVAKMVVFMLNSLWYRRIKDVIMNIEVQAATDEPSVTNPELLKDNLYPIKIQCIIKNDVFSIS